MDRANLLNIDELVMEMEALFQKERQGWVATSMTSKMLAKKTKEAKGSSSAGDDGDSSLGTAI